MKYNHLNIRIRKTVYCKVFINPWFMRWLLYISFILIVNLKSVAQIDKLSNFEKVKTGSIKIGMSVSDIKSLHGNPINIELGFPDSEISICRELPQNKGQLYYTSWIYEFQSISIMWEDPSTIQYSINGYPSTVEDYEAYKTIDKVYIFKNIVVSPYAGRQLIYNNYEDAKVEEIISRKMTTAKKTPLKFKPFLYVIFEKGTQSVNDKRMYFLIVE